MVRQRCWFCPYIITNIEIPIFNGMEKQRTIYISYYYTKSFNAIGTVLVTGSSDTHARVWNAYKTSNDDPEQPNREMDILAGHENDINYVQFRIQWLRSGFYLMSQKKKTFQNSKINGLHMTTLLCILVMAVQLFGFQNQTDLYVIFQDTISTFCNKSKGCQ